jgi:glycosyltransferase involved in cell wall biosynthesis
VREEAQRRLMRLAYLDPHPVPDDCPEALQILYTVDALGEIGVDVVLVTPRPRRDIRPEDILGRPLSSKVRVQHLPDPRKRWWFPSASNKPFYWMAARALRHIGADVVLVRNLKMAEHLLKRVPRVPLVFETHELFAQSFREEHANRSVREERKLRALEEREGFVYRHAAGLLALTPLLLEDIRQTYGVDTPAEIAPDGVDLRQAEPPKTLPPNPIPVLLYLGSLHPWKGVDTLILAMKHVTRPAMLHIVGGSDRRIAELRALAEREGVADRVVLPGPVAPGRRFEWIHKADICLLPLTSTSIASRYTSPLKLFEYLAAGKPVVASDLPSMRSVLEPGKHALLVKAGDVYAFAAAIDRLLAEPALGKQLGEAARVHARRFSWQERGRRLRHFGEGLKTLP